MNFPVKFQTKKISYKFTKEMLLYYFPDDFTTGAHSDYSDARVITVTSPSQQRPYKKPLEIFLHDTPAFLKFDDAADPTLETDSLISSQVHNFGTLSPPASVSSLSTDNISINPSDVPASFQPGTESSMKCSKHKMEFEHSDKQLFLNVLHHQGCLICNICGKSYAQKNNLDNHIQMHYGNFYYCEEEGCDKKFGTLRGLEMHAVKHARSSFECTLCHCKFASEEKLQGHMNLHVTQKWSCELCGKKMSRRSNMKKHKNKNCPKRDINLTSASESDLDTFVTGSSRSLRSKNSDLEVLKIVNGTPKKTVEKSVKSPLLSIGTVTKQEKLEKLRTVLYRIVHKRESIYVCQNCLTGYPSRNALFDHKRVGSCKQSRKKM